jgi:predicted O-methyltransferase YrrM
MAAQPPPNFDPEDYQWGPRPPGRRVRSAAEEAPVGGRSGTCDPEWVPGAADLVDTVRRVRARLGDIRPNQTMAEGDFERVALPCEHCDALRNLLLAEQARAVIEVGLGYGSSALAIGEALAVHEDATHIIIDAFQDHFGDVGWKAIVEAGLETRCTLLPERSQVALPRLLTEGVVADAAFVDGSHIFHNVFVDLYFLRELVRPGGLIVLDDCEWPSVATALRYFELNAEWRAVGGGRPPRLRAFRLPDPRIEPQFKDFKPFGGCSPA